MKLGRVSLPIIQKCDILKEYCEFIEAVFREKSSLKPNCTEEEARAALEQAMKECIKKDILADYLIRKGTEVLNMFFGEYSYEEDIAAQREEAKEEGLQQKAEEVARNALAMNLSVEQASKISGLSTDQIKALKTTSSAMA